MTTSEVMTALGFKKTVKHKWVHNELPLAEIEDVELPEMAKEMNRVFYALGREHIQAQARKLLGL